MRLSCSTRVCTLAENCLSTSTWTETCCGVGIRFSKPTPTVSVFLVLANTGTSWPRMSTSGSVSHSLSAYHCHVNHPQRRWWFRRQRKDQGFVISLPQSVLANSPAVDENLFYKGVDKSAVHGARLHQTHSVEKGDAVPMPPQANDPGHPPYPFESGNSLLALTKRHNVGCVGSILQMLSA